MPQLINLPGETGPKKSNHEFQKAFDVVGN
jgi:hypothetical protein